jgi:hypothetical protein
MATRTTKARPEQAAKAGRERRDEETSGKALRALDEAFSEERYDSAAGGSAYLGAVLLSLGGVLLGAGTYALAGIPTGKWHDNAAAMLLGGLIFEAGFFALGGKAAGPLYVGELGVGREEDGKLRRIAWWEMKRIAVTDGQLVIETASGPLTLPIEPHAAAVARIVAEAQKRIPKRVTLGEGVSLGTPRPGTTVEAEPPQVAGAVCRATGEALTFEKDVRMCDRCGALYHRAGVPRRCTECDQKLR